MGVPSLSSLKIPPGILSGGWEQIAALILAVIQLLLVIAVVAALIFILLGAIKWIISGGDKQSLAGAKAQITYALIGLILAFLSFAILKLMSSFFQINLGTGMVGRDWSTIDNTINGIRER